MVAELTGARKAAVLAAMLGPRKAAEVLARSGLQPAQVEVIAAELCALGDLDEQTRKAVWREFGLRASPGAGAGGPVVAEEILRRVLGPEQASEALARLRPRRARRPFASLAALGARQLAHLLRAERPCAIAIVLRHLPRRAAGALLSSLPAEVRTEVVLALVKGADPLPDALADMDALLRRRAAQWGADGERDADSTTAAGPRTLVEILNQTDLAVENAVLAALAERDPQVGERVRESMFIFDDLPGLEPRALQLALREVEGSDLAVALKAASEEVKQAVFDNLSENAAAALKEELELLGPVRRRDVLAAQEKVVMAVRALAAEGKILIRKQDEEDLIA